MDRILFAGMEWEDDGGSIQGIMPDFFFTKHSTDADAYKLAYNFLIIYTLRACLIVLVTSIHVLEWIWLEHKLFSTSIHSNSHGFRRIRVHPNKAQGNTQITHASIG